MANAKFYELRRYGICHVAKSGTEKTFCGIPLKALKAVNWWRAPRDGETCGDCRDIRAGRTPQLPQVGRTEEI